MKLTFYRKAISNLGSTIHYRWFISWLNWLIPENNREMVCGTEDMLERISGSANMFTLRTGAKFPKIILRLKYKINFGGWYSVEVLDEFTKNNLKMPKEVWICNVTRFVFGHMPKEIRITWDD
ncbi:MAG: hypothetical protein MJZ16_00130 [Bacteroidales bacterium]|nr:hypothetical protein [Bacteroidales bacterium]